MRRSSLSRACHRGRRLQRLRDDQGGFTLVEVMAAITVLAVGIFGAAQALNIGLTTTGLSRQRLAARAGLDQQMEEARALNYDNLVLSDPDPGLTHSMDASNPDYWVNTAGQTYDPDGTGPLSPEPIVRVAGASPALQHYQNPFVVGSTTYTVYRYVTWVDSPTDGTGAADKADGNNDGVSDANGHDEKRVTVVVTWTDEFGRTPVSQSQSSLFTDGKIVYKAPAKNTAPTVSCPTVTTPWYQFYTSGGNLTLTSQASDPDGNIATVSWTITRSDGTMEFSQTGAWLTTKSVTHTFPITDATYSIVNTVTDNGGSVSSNASLNCTLQTPDLAGNGGPSEDMSMNAGATYTTNQIVTLTFTKAHNPAYFQISNDALTWAPKQAFTSTTSWTLTSGDGQKWVYARFYDSTGKYGPAVWKSITLDTGPPPAPTNLKVVSTTTSGPNKTLVLGWTAVTGVSDLGGYRLYSRIITSTGSFNLICTTASTSCNATTKKTDSYEYYVIAYDIAGNQSAQSNHVTG
jgi:prepilin-type N-terminal cleavage/methylation domain-containing protein